MIDLSRWENALSFYSEADPLGVIGSTLLDKLDQKQECFQFKHHYMLHALDSRILLQLLTSIGEKRYIKLANTSRRKEIATIWHFVLPLKIFISTQGGRQYLLCYHNRFHALQFFRIDYIKEIELLEQETDFSVYERYCEKYRSHCWGTSAGAGFRVDHLEMTVHFEDNEQHIPHRLEREKRNGRVEMVDQNTCKYIVDTYDASEMVPWLRTFIGRIQKLECSDQTVVDKFYQDLEEMYYYLSGGLHIMKKMIINENQKGFLFKNGKYMKLLDAGKYHLFGGKEIEISNLDQPIACSKCALETLLADKSVAERVTVVEVGDEELALHYVNGKFSSVLRQGKHAFWSVVDQHEFKIVDVSTPEVDTAIPAYIFSQIPQIYYTKIEVAEYQKARLYFNQKLVRILDAGTYYFWKTATKVDVGFVDTRLTQMNITGQEILTADTKPGRV